MTREGPDKSYILLGVNRLVPDSLGRPALSWVYGPKSASSACVHPTLPEVFVRVDQVMFGQLEWTDFDIIGDQLDFENYSRFMDHLWTILMF